MAIKILAAPHPVLINKSQSVSAKNGPTFGWDKKVLKIIEELKKTINLQRNPKGVGLAAPQIGYPLRIFIAKHSPKANSRVFINPEITWLSPELTPPSPASGGAINQAPPLAGRSTKPRLWRGDQPPSPLIEGCLSIPGIWGKVKRHESLKLRYFTPDGKTHHQKFEGFLATIIQHEMDHLNGCLFPQRVLEQKGKLYRGIKNKKGENELEEIEIA